MTTQLTLKSLGHASRSLHKAPSNGRELGDAELVQVSGGLNPQPLPPAPPPPREGHIFIF